MLRLMLMSHLINIRSQITWHNGDHNHLLQREMFEDRLQKLPTLTSRSIPGKVFVHVLLDRIQPLLGRDRYKLSDH